MIRSFPNFVLILSYRNATIGSVIASKIRVPVRMYPTTSVVIPYPMLAL